MTSSSSTVNTIASAKYGNAIQEVKEKNKLNYDQWKTNGKNVTEKLAKYYIRQAFFNSELAVKFLLVFTLFKINDCKNKVSCDKFAGLIREIFNSELCLLGLSNHNEITKKF